jgi:probable HAF family extracellular repeat protein
MAADARSRLGFDTLLREAIMTLFVPRCAPRPLLALGLAGLLAACSGSHRHPAKPPPLQPGGVTYDVIALNPRGETWGHVGPKGINANGLVAGYNVDPATSGRRAFMYDGARVFELGSFGGPYSAATAINRCGHVTGWAQTADGSSHAFLYDGALHDLGKGEGTAINDCGTVTGYAAIDGNGFVFGGLLRPTGALDGGTASLPTGINASGLVTGLAWFSTGQGHAFLYDSRSGGGLRDLGTLGGPGSEARALNDAGQVVGQSQERHSRMHAFRYSGGVLRDLGSAWPDGTSVALDINASGQAVGNSYHPDTGEVRGFFHDGTTRHDLDRHTSVAAINAGGQVVGTYYGPDPRAILWTRADGIVDLNTRLRAPPGLRVLEGLAISDKGSIVARASTGLVLLRPRR